MEVKASILKSFISPIAGSIILAVAAAGGIGVVWLYSAEQNLPPTPFIEVFRNASGRKIVGECEVGKVCPTSAITAVDPEGDPIVFKFIDQATGQEVIPAIKTQSGQPIKPEFKFNQAGEKQIYVVVQDGAGHTSSKYPMVVDVKAEQTNPK